MADSIGGHSSHIDQAPLGSHLNGQAQSVSLAYISDLPLPEGGRNIIGNATQADIGSRTEAQEKAIKDQVDGAIASGPKRADPSTGGRVQVGETGDLHDLAARRQS